MKQKLSALGINNGSVVSLARKHGIHVPVNSLLVQLVHAVEDSCTDEE